MKMLAASVFALLIAAQTAGAAGEPRISGTIPNVVVRDETPAAFARRVVEGIARVDEVAAPQCSSRGFTFKALTKVTGNDPVLAEESKGRPVWLLRVEGTGCGVARKHNVHLFEQSEGPIKFVPTLPGDTAANVKLQIDALQIIQPAAEAMGSKACPDHTVVIDTKIVDAPNGRSPWSESWTFRKCGADLRFRMTFTPDATGAGISARRE